MWARARRGASAAATGEPRDALLPLAALDLWAGQWAAPLAVLWASQLGGLLGERLGLGSGRVWA